MTTQNLVSRRLVIKSTQEEDGPLCLSIWLDEEMGEYLSDPPLSHADERYLSFAKGIENQEGWYPFIAVLKETGEFVGTCSLVPSEDHKEWNLGYCVHKKFWRQGFASEMIGTLMGFVHQNGGTALTANVAQKNVGSNSLLKKLGFSVEREGSFKKRGTDIVYEAFIYRREL